MTRYFLIAMISLLVAFFAAGSANAEKMKSLYAATWPVSDQSQQVRQRGLANAFAQVFVRASGKPSVVQNEAVRASLVNAADYLRQYSYKKLGLEEQKIYRKPLLLVASFDPKAVTQILKDAGEPVWSNSRPRGVFWVSVDDDEQSGIAADGQNPVAVSIRRAAGKRGLPVSIPKMDAEDKAALVDEFSFSPETLARASARYNGEYLVSGKLALNNEQWRARWNVTGATNMNFTTAANSKQEAVNKMVNRIADQMANKMAVVLTNHSEIAYLVIQDLPDIESYAWTQNYLKNLSIVSQVSALQVQQGSVLFEVTIQSSALNLLSAMDVSQQLTRSTDFDSNNQQDAYYYRWTR